MTRKHFEAVAKVIAEVYQNETGPGSLAADAVAVRKVAEGLAFEFGWLNPRFDSDRFLAACKVEK
jgi:hypothetical protein